MGERISYDPDDIEAVGNEVCPDIANFYDDAASKAATAGRSRSAAFGDHRLAETWSELFEAMYEVLYESATNIRAMGPTLKDIADDQRILEGELSQSFEGIADEIADKGHSPQPSEHYEEAPRTPPSTAEKDDNPYERFININYHESA